MDNNDKTYTTLNGQTVSLRAVSQLVIAKISEAVLKEFKDNQEPLEVPTYLVTNGAGVVEQLPHDPTTLESPEEQVAWNKYLDATTRLENATTLRVTKYALLEGLDYAPPDDRWEKLQKHLGLTIPDDPYEKQLHYIMTDILRTPGDQAGAAQKIILLSMDGLPKETLAAVRKSFRGETEDRPAEGVAYRFAEDGGNVGTLAADGRSSHGLPVGPSESDLLSGAY